jgi:hypothetical protein
MRTYHSRGYRLLSGGSIEIEGQWSGVRWIAFGLLALIPLVAKAEILLGAVALASAYLFVFPPRRRVVFDVARRSLRVEHAGLLGERARLTLPFDEVRAVVFAPAGRRGGRALVAVSAETTQGTAYLVTHADAPGTPGLSRVVRDVLQERNEDG